MRLHARFPFAHALKTQPKTTKKVPPRRHAGKLKLTKTNSKTLKYVVGCKWQRQDIANASLLTRIQLSLLISIVLPEKDKACPTRTGSAKFAKHGDVGKCYITSVVERIPLQTLSLQIVAYEIHDVNWRTTKHTNMGKDDEAHKMP